MANPKKRVPENVPGDFFVDSTCIDCDACRQIAPSVFGEAAATSFVKAQPSLADAAMGFAYAATLAEGETFTTIELKINFLGAVRKATLIAEARVVKAGSNLGYVECEVKDQTGKMVAKAASTCMKLHQNRI